MLALALQLLADPAVVWMDSHRAFQAGEFAQACDGYQTVATEFASGHAYYNLGNCRLRSGDLGAAVAALRQAQSLLPRDADVAANLTHARAQTADKVVPPTPNRLWSILFFWHQGMNRRELVGAAAAANALVWLLLMLRWWLARSELLRFGVWGTGVVAAMFVASGAIRLLVPQKVAVAQPEQVEVYAGLSRDSVVRFKVHAGAEMMWSERRGDFVRVRLSDGKDGWVAAQDVALLSL